MNRPNQRRRLTRSCALLQVERLERRTVLAGPPVLDVPPFEREIVVEAVDDTFTSAGATTKNYSRSKQLQVSDRPLKYSWLKFTVSGLAGPVERAAVRLFATANATDDVDLYAADNNDWSETTLTWSNQPATVGDPVDSVDAVLAGMWHEWDVTDVVAGNGTYRFALRSASGRARFAAGEVAGRSPKLVLDLADPPTGPTSVRFAVIGDYGTGSKKAGEVAKLVQGWQPDFIITTGDNNYEDGAASTIDRNIGQFYHDYIAPYRGVYGPGADVNRFFPSLGNHDWHTAGAAPYLDYFTLPGNERYYEFTSGPVHLFAIDSDPAEPDGVTSDSTQGQWLADALAASDSCWDIVYMHHAPYASGRYGPHDRVQWPYRAWGADAVLAGHDHNYERLVIDGFPYFVNGLGGKSRYRFLSVEPGSEVRYNAGFGAMLVEATTQSIVFQFVTTKGQVIDRFEVNKRCV